MPGNINTIPTSVIEAWPAPNYINPERRTWLPAWACALQAVSTLMVLTRLWLRTRKQAGKFGLDDAFLIPGWLASIVMTVFTILSAKYYGADRHIWDVQLSLFEPLAEAAWASELIFIITTGCTKISVLLFYRRLVAGSYSRRWKIATIIAIWFTVLYCLAFGLLLTFNCTPLDAYWKSYRLDYTEDYYCVDTSTANPLSGVVSVISDFYSVLLPCLMLRHFDAPKRQKIALNIVFSLGLFVVAAGIARTYYLNKLGHSWDITWTGFDVYVWSQLEIQLALICAAAPALRVFFRTYLSNNIKRSMNSTMFGGSQANPEVASTGPMPYTPERSTSIEPFASDIKHSMQASEHVVNERDIDLEAAVPVPTDFCSLKSPATIDWPLPNPQKGGRVGPQLVRTPADFESYALHNLQKNRPSVLVSADGPATRMTFLRPSSEEDLPASPEKHFEARYGSAR